MSQDESNPNNLEVAWDAIPCVDNYKVQYRTINKDQCNNTVGPMTWFWDGIDSFVTITSLKPYSTYEVFVTSNNSLGYSETSAQGVTYITGTFYRNSFYGILTSFLSNYGMVMYFFSCAKYVFLDFLKKFYNKPKGILVYSHTVYIIMFFMFIVSMWGSVVARGEWGCVSCYKSVYIM